MSERRKAPKSTKEREEAADEARSDAVVTLSVGAGDPLQAAGLFDHLAIAMQDARTRARPKGASRPKRLRTQAPKGAGRDRKKASGGKAAAEKRRPR
jgi:hypothetical protein